MNIGYDRLYQVDAYRRALRWWLANVIRCMLWWQVNGRFGWSVAVLDINADGQLDVVVSSPSADSSQLQYHGAVYVYFGQSAVNQTRLSSRPNVVMRCTVRITSHSTIAMHRGSLLLQMSHVAWSVCLCVCTKTA